MNVEPRDYCIDADNDNRSAQVIQVESSRLTPLHIALSAMALLVAGIALGVSWRASAGYARDYRELEREVRLNTQATDDMRASLIARGINPNAHDITDVGGDKP